MKYRIRETGRAWVLSPEKEGGSRHDFIGCSHPGCSMILEQEENGAVSPRVRASMAAVSEAALTGKDWTPGWAAGGSRVPAGRGAGPCLLPAPAQVGIPCGISNLGWCLENGIGVGGRPQTGRVALPEQAAPLDHVPAMCNFGFCPQNGIGTGRDPERAVEWYRKAAEMTFPGSRSCLPGRYHEGIGVERDEAGTPGLAEGGGLQGTRADRLSWAAGMSSATGGSSPPPSPCAGTRAAAEQGMRGRHVPPGVWL